ncbi:class F sortase [Candidatus Saccharibacteria bacterium]|nr:class F sortase [Candidatus Saccharibacteria bacterium]
MNTDIKIPENIPISNNSPSEDRLDAYMVDSVARAKSLLDTKVGSATQPVVSIQEENISNIVSTIQEVAGAKKSKTDLRKIASETLNTLLHQPKVLLKNKLFYAVLVAVFTPVLFGVLVSAFMNFSNNSVNKKLSSLNPVADAASAQTESQASSLPSEDVIPQVVIDNYSVPATTPKYLEVPSIGIQKTRILQVGLDDKSQIRTTRSVWDTGWYEASSKPNDASGSVLIGGYISGKNDVGVFYNLYKLTDGDMVKVTTGDNHEYSYKIISKTSIPDGDYDVSKFTQSINTDKPGLTLITFEGELNPKTGTQEQRMAVFAIRVE